MSEISLRREAVKICREVERRVIENRVQHAVWQRNGLRRTKHFQCCDGIGDFKSVVRFVEGTDPIDELDILGVGLARMPGLTGKVRNPIEYEASLVPNPFAVPGPGRSLAPRAHCTEVFWRNSNEVRASF